MKPEKLPDIPPTVLQDERYALAADLVRAYDAFCHAIHHEEDCDQITQELHRIQVVLRFQLTPRRPYTNPDLYDWAVDAVHTIARTAIEHNVPGPLGKGSQERFIAMTEEMPPILSANEDENTQEP